VLVLGEHEVFRRSLTQIEAPEDPAQLAERWRQLADGLEVHASAEETIFYPELLQGVDHAQDDTQHAVHDHNQIRDAVRGVHSHPVGADQWWAAFRQARAVTADHLDEEEREMLPPFRDGIGADKRNELGIRWRSCTSSTTGPKAYPARPKPRGLRCPARLNKGDQRGQHAPGVDVLVQGATGSPPCAAGAVPRRTVRPASGTPGPHGPVPVFALPR